ncbi:alpha-hydroxy-acid oxidizing protein [Bacillus salitolerans]|uniref:L-lactate oxidase n=1 Tax=Bacillus salitolerans TaxID=1437434 RepID=A0ABW4LJ38_9BACI
MSVLRRKHLYHFEDLESEAAKAMDPHPFSYVQSGAGHEETLQDNTRDFRKWKIRPKFLNDVSKRDLSISIFGETFDTPYFLAPIGNLGIVHPEAELAVARAAKRFNLPYIASTVTTFSLEEIAKELGTNPRWFQLYCSQDRNITQSFIQRAELAGYTAIVVTIDTPTAGWRTADLSNQYFPLKLGTASGNYFADPVFRSSLIQPPEKDFDTAIEKQMDVFFSPSFTWEDIQFIQNVTKLPVLLKGILHPIDAQKAMEYGVDGIVVSNHGGRQLDGCISTIAALPEIIEVIQGKIPVLFDSGIRKGADAFKALALGADAVLLGRPYVYGLAVNGEEGVSEVLGHFIQDLDVSLATAGVASVNSLNRSLLVKV